MANLNTFRTITKVLSSVESVIYTAPANITAIVLMAQVTNVTANETDVTVIHNDTSESVSTELVKGFSVPGNDASGVISGKLVIETGNSISGLASDDNRLKITMSILESLNA